MKVLENNSELSRNIQRHEEQERNSYMDFVSKYSTNFESIGCFANIDVVWNGSDHFRTIFDENYTCEIICRVFLKHTEISETEPDTPIKEFKWLISKADKSSKGLVFLTFSLDEDDVEDDIVSFIDDFDESFIQQNNKDTLQRHDFSYWSSKPYNKLNKHEKCFFWTMIFSISFLIISFVIACIYPQIVWLVYIAVAILVLVAIGIIILIRPNRS